MAFFGLVIRVEVAALVGGLRRRMFYCQRWGEGGGVCCRFFVFSGVDKIGVFKHTQEIYQWGRN